MKIKVQKRRFYGNAEADAPHRGDLHIGPRGAWVILTVEPHESRKYPHVWNITRTPQTHLRLENYHSRIDQIRTLLKDRTITPRMIPIVQAPPSELNCEERCRCIDCR